MINFRQGVMHRSPANGLTKCYFNNKE
jgi:hypothetical protein